MSREELARRIRAGIESETELAVDPALFPALRRGAGENAQGDGEALLPRLAGVEVHVEQVVKVLAILAGKRIGGPVRTGESVHEGIQ